MRGCGSGNVARRVGAALLAVAMLLSGFTLRAIAGEASAVDDANAVAVDMNVTAATPMAANRIGTASLKDLAAAANGQLAAPASPDAAQAHAGAIAALPRPIHNRMITLPANSEISGEAAASPLFSFVPRAFSRRIASKSAPVLFGFPGLDALDSAIANGLNVNSPALGYAVEPPDQGLCVGNGLVVEAVNIVMSMYTTSGTPVMQSTPLYAIFGVSSTDFISDPRCIYDSPTNTFFVSMTDLGPNQAGPSSLLIAAINARTLAVNSYAIATNDDGGNGGVSHPGCPCFGDQPLLGADQYGVYVTTNEFSLNPNDPNGNGAQIYAINKADLVAGGPTAEYSFFPAAIPLAGNTAFSIQPAVATDGVFDRDNGGTEFLMSSLDFDGAGDRRIAVWAIVNSCAIPSDTTTPCLGMPELVTPPPVIRMGAYSDPPPAVQKSGPIPFGNSVGAPLEEIDTGDDRMQQVVYAGGKLYAGLTTAVIVRGRLHAGIRTFRVIPNFRRFRTRHGVVQKFIARPFGTTLLALAGADVYYPSIGVTADGRAVMAFSLSGANYYPSAAWVPLYRTGRPWINFAAAGAGPDDGFTGYQNYSSGAADIGRWGDYTAATAVGNQIWMGAEFIGNACSPAIYSSDPLCGNTRAPDANWDTYLSEFVVKR
jgi:hypothetical protein